MIHWFEEKSRQYDLLAERWSYRGRSRLAALYRALSAVAHRLSWIVRE